MDGSHKHQCDECGFIWEHGDHNAGNEETHICPCGEVVWERYYEDGTPDYVGCQQPRRSEDGKPIIEHIDRNKVRQACAACDLFNELDRLLADIFLHRVQARVL